MSSNEGKSANQHLTIRALPPRCRMTESEIKLTVFFRDWLQTSESRLYDHVSHMFRWLLATLFAANGGAILGLIGSAKRSQDLHRDALCWFAAGLVLSIGMGIASAFAGLRMTDRIHRARVEAERALAGAEPDQKPIQALIDRSQVTWKRFVPTYVGVASFLCLIIGMLVIATEL
jgi:hypothetical protein